MLADDGVATVELFLADAEGDDVEAAADGVGVFACVLKRLVDGPATRDGVTDEEARGATDDDLEVEGEEVEAAAALLVFCFSPARAVS